MDFVKGALKSGSGSSGSTGNTNQAAGGAGKEDYGDKGSFAPLPLSPLILSTYFAVCSLQSIICEYHVNNVLSSRLHREEDRPHYDPRPE